MNKCFLADISVKHTNIRIIVKDDILKCCNNTKYVLRGDFITSLALESHTLL